MCHWGTANANRMSPRVAREQSIAMRLERRRRQVGRIASRTLGIHGVATPHTSLGTSALPLPHGCVRSRPRPGRAAAKVSARPGTPQGAAQLPAYLHVQQRVATVLGASNGAFSGVALTDDPPSLAAPSCGGRDRSPPDSSPGGLSHFCSVVTWPQTPAH